MSEKPTQPPMTPERRAEIDALKTCLRVDRMRHQRALDDALAEVDRLTGELANAVDALSQCTGRVHEDGLKLSKCEAKLDAARDEAQALVAEIERLRLAAERTKDHVPCHRCDCWFVPAGEYSAMCPNCDEIERLRGENAALLDDLQDRIGHK